MRLSSQPPGATVTLVDNGTMSVIGTTPLDVRIDPTRRYDVVLTLAAHETQVATLRHDAKELALDLAPIRTTARKRSAPRPAGVASTAAVSAPVVRTAAPRPRVASVGAARRSEGTLMVSSKPPCEIVIDGVATVLMTPQPALKLKPGKHKVTLFNTRYNIDATIDVVIEPGKATKLIRDFTAQMARAAPR